MTDTKPLRMMALDAEDLTVISAVCQDAVLKVKDIVFDRSRGHFSLVMNRLSEDKTIRRRSILDFARVSAVRRKNVPQSAAETVLALLAVLADTKTDGQERVTLVFAEDRTISLDVECIEARLADTDAAWAAGAKPRHGV